jgi:hypothetical protein
MQQDSAQIGVWKPNVLSVINDSTGHNGHTLVWDSDPEENNTGPTGGGKWHN